ncbi:AAA family ATPase [Alteromonas lipolytica]|uniref:AAA family ATPase n=1 Tax=Alteromonas lipolytica TaxID=1856405 RepID=A0A1E8FJI7_9ALTE|nr:MoxR family ATPase [Alteromonas lipolytica]OFI36085.1 AAA family ATPase [Alteromonas lipolytica]GGF71077.1 ATPase AAA [Alteromonas lipolytica]
MHTDLTQALHYLEGQILGKPHQIKLAMTCLLANGHLLIEDLPGMGKTTLSHALATVFGLEFARIQFTSDLLPADMLGVNIYNTQQGEFEFHKGPIFSQVVLADEINRASPKTQSALLEAMEEHQVSIDGQTRALPQPFFVIATQNPSYQAGTYPLPESQLDRFLMRISLGYPDNEAEKRMLRESAGMSSHHQPRQAPPLSSEQLQTLQSQVCKVHVSDPIVDYLLRLVNQSRDNSEFPYPLSPRASKALLRAAQAWALLHQRDYVLPEDLQAIFTAVAEHRLRGSQTDYRDDGLLSQRILSLTDPLAA